MSNASLTPVEQREGVTKSVFKYMSFDVAMDVIINSWLRISRLHSLNDPFEWNVKADSGKEREPLEKNFAQIFKEFDSRCGILCFSSVSDSTLMWSHYADSHRGIVLELEVDGLQEVVYSEPPTVSEVAASLRNQMWGMTSDNSMFYLRKRREWAYENELRKICFFGHGAKRTPGVEGHHEKHYSARLFGNTITILGTERSPEIHYYWRFRRNALKSIHFGVNCPKNRREALSRQLLQLRHSMVKSFQMKTNPRTGKLFKDEISLEQS